MINYDLKFYRDKKDKKKKKHRSRSRSRSRRHRSRSRSRERRRYNIPFTPLHYTFITSMEPAEIF